MYLSSIRHYADSADSSIFSTYTIACKVVLWTTMSWLINYDMHVMLGLRSALSEIANWAALLQRGKAVLCSW